MVSRTFKGDVEYAYYWDGVGKDRKKKWYRLSDDPTIADIKYGELLERLRSKKDGVPLNPAKISWASFCEDYKRLTASRKAPASRERDELAIETFNEISSLVDLSDMRPAALEHFIAGRAKKVKPSTINRDLNTLKAMSRRAWEWGYLKEDPWRQVKKFHVDPTEPKRFSEDQKQQIWDYCSDYYERVVADFGLLQGMRPGEMERAKWSQMDFEFDDIIIPPQSVQNPKKKPRRIPMHRQTLADLMAWKKESDSEYVLGLHGRQMSSRYIARIYKKLLKRAGIKGHIYMARHTFGSNLSERGRSLRAIQELLGHSRVTTTQIYTHPSQEERRAAVKSLPGSNNGRKKKGSTDDK